VRCASAVAAPKQIAKAAISAAAVRRNLIVRNLSGRGALPAKLAKIKANRLIPKAILPWPNLGANG
jgi:hypothetical protein